MRKNGKSYTRRTSLVCNRFILLTSSKTKRCSSCSSQLPLGATYCDGCGAKQPESSLVGAPPSFPKDQTLQAHLISILFGVFFTVIYWVIAYFAYVYYWVYNVHTWWMGFYFAIRGDPIWGGPIWTPLFLPMMPVFTFFAFLLSRHRLFEGKNQKIWMVGSTFLSNFVFTLIIFYALWSSSFPSLPTALSFAGYLTLSIGIGVFAARRFSHTGK